MTQAANNVGKLTHIVSVMEARFGAKGDGSTDDTAAIQAAINAAEADGGGVVWLPAGTFKTTATLTLPTYVSLKGSGRGTIIVVSHVLGAGVRINGSWSGLDDLFLQSSAARTAAANVADVGVLIQPLAGTSNFATWLKRVQIGNQGSHGCWAENTEFLTVEDCRFLNNKGHGFYGDAATVDEASNYLRFGICEIKNCQFNGNTGHSICIGVQNYGFRVVVENCDQAENALASGVRISAHAAYINAQNTIVRSSAHQCEDASDTPATAGLYLDGRNSLVEGCRFLNVTGCAVELGPDADGARILDPHVLGAFQSTLDQAVIVDASVAGVYVRCGFPANITNPMTVGAGSRGNKSEWYDISPQGVRSAYSPVTIADDAVKTYTFSGVTYGVMVLSANSTSGKPAMVGFRVGDGSAYCVLLAGDAADITVGTGALTGTTGADTKLNISVSTTANILYIENRQGASANFMPTFLSLAGLTNGGEVLLT